MEGKKKILLKPPLKERTDLGHTFNLTFSDLSKCQLRCIYRSDQPVLGILIKKAFNASANGKVCGNLGFGQ